MNKLRRLIRWFIPVGLAVRLIRKCEFGRCGIEGSLFYSRNGRPIEIPLYSAYETPFYGVFLVYSKERHNKEINWKIEDLNEEIEKLEGRLK